eukprot:5830678-Alexandrium_andersonii.AAC.1
MSASLVSSEMCIRDRASSIPSSATGTHALAHAGPLGPTQGCRPRPWSSGPVSYTHLTLPTICSV